MQQYLTSSIFKIAKLLRDYITIDTLWQPLQKPH